MKILLALGALVLAAFYGGPASAQSSAELKALAKEVEALKAGQASMQRDLLEIKNLLLQQALQQARDALEARRAEGQAPSPAQAQAPAQAQPQTPVISVADAPFKGMKTAKLTLIDFSDFQ